MKIFSDLIGRVFGKDEEKPATKKKLEIKDTVSIDPERAAEKAAEEARKKAQEKLATQATKNNIDVVKILDARAKARSKEGIDWRRSIVDLMKICGMDSSYNNRAALAKELGYTGTISKGASAKMNMWLHKEMMRQIVANGGKVPAKMLD